MKLSTYILTGGNSTRMGTDKALRLYRGQAFIQYVLNALKPLGSEIKLVSSHKKHHHLNFGFVKDIEENKGPVSGVFSALSDSKTTWNLILSCDIPLLKTSFIKWLIQNHDANFDCTIPLVNEKKMPLTAIYNQTCKKIFSKHLQHNQLKVMRVLEDLEVNYINVPFQFHEQLTNVNTPEQLKEISI